MHPLLEEVVADAEAARVELLGAVTPLSDADWGRHSASGGWTIGEVVAHLALVEDSSVRALFRGFRTARDGGLGPETATTSMLGTLDRTKIEGAEHRLVAPPLVTPSAAPDRADVMQKLAYSREGLRTWSREADGFALSGVVFPHPALGPLNLYQWVLFLGMHERRHLHQILRILAS